jgi:FKBP-type peptidyl-prolyl cis-trans isomerase
MELGFGAAEADLITKGFIAGAVVSEPDPAMMAKMPAFQEFIEPRVVKAQAAADAEAAKEAAASSAAVEAFFKALAADPEVQKSESGLYYKVITPGADATPAMTDTVLVHYKGTLIDGTKFDSSYDRGAPATFPLNGVVPGFGEGLTKIGAGGKIILYIPSELGYGQNPRPGGAIKPGDALIFECELVEVNPGS